jgi:hypothetical protein
MAEYLGHVTGQSNSISREYPVSNGVTVTAGDLVYLDATGRVAPWTTGKRIFGLVDAGASSGSGLIRPYSATAVGNAAGTVTVLVNIEDKPRLLIKCDNVTNTLSEASQGQYFNLIGTTGAQLVSGASKSATAGQLLCLQFNPGIRGTDATYGIFTIAQPQADVG